MKVDHKQLLVFMNQVHGEPWRESVDEVSARAITKEREGARERDVVPAHAKVIIVFCRNYHGPAIRNWSLA